MYFDCFSYSLLVLHKMGLFWLRIRKCNIVERKGKEDCVTEMIAKSKAKESSSWKDCFKFLITPSIPFHYVFLWILSASSFLRFSFLSLFKGRFYIFSSFCAKRLMFSGLAFWISLWFLREISVHKFVMELFVSKWCWIYLLIFM